MPRKIDDSEPLGVLVAVGRRVVEARNAAGVTQDELAKRLLLDRAAVGRVERGAKNVTIATLARIAHALDVTIANLLTDVEVDDARIAELDAASGRRGDRSKK